MVDVEEAGPMHGDSRRVQVTITGLSVRPTSEGPRYPYTEFGPDFIAAVHERLKGPRRRGLVRSTLSCPACAASLDGIDVDRVIVAVDVDLSRIPPIHLDLEMPGMLCPGCAMRLVMVNDRSVQSDLSDAIIDAFNRAGIVPA
jgi:hypothetical protein